MASARDNIWHRIDEDKTTVAKETAEDHSNTLCSDDLNIATVVGIVSFGISQFHPEFTQESLTIWIGLNLVEVCLGRRLGHTIRISKAKCNARKDSRAWEPRPHARFKLYYYFQEERTLILYCRTAYEMEERVWFTDIYIFLVKWEQTNEGNL